MTAAETLQKRAARLTTRQTHRVARDTGESERVTLEPLLELLLGQVGSSHTLTGGGASGPKSKPPIAVDAFDLLAEIDDLVADGCREYELTVRYVRPEPREILAGVVVREMVGSDRPKTPTDYRLVDRMLAALTAAGYGVRVNPGAGAPRDVIGNLRQLVPALLADAKGDPNDELLAYWSNLLGEWTTKVEASIGDREEGSAAVPLPIPCPAPLCGAEKHLRVEAGETFSEPALVAHVFRHEVQSVTCRACSSTWQRGAALDDFVFDSLGGVLAGVPRTDALGYDLALGYAPPMFRGGHPVQVIDLDDEDDDPPPVFRVGERVEVFEVPGGYVVIPEGASA